MIKYENQCYDCAVSGYPCIGDDCPMLNIPVYHCDFCGFSNSEYDINNEHYCDQCARKYLNERFNELSIKEMGEILEVTLKQLNDRW